MEVFECLSCPPFQAPHAMGVGAAFLGSLPGSLREIMETISWYVPIMGDTFFEAGGDNEVEPHFYFMHQAITVNPVSSSARLCVDGASAGDDGRLWQSSFSTTGGIVL